MKTRSTPRRHRNSWVGSATSIGFALLPLGAMLWAVPHTGLGID